MDNAVVKQLVKTQIQNSTKLKDQTTTTIIYLPGLRKERCVKTQSCGHECAEICGHEKGSEVHEEGECIRSLNNSLTPCPCCSTTWNTEELNRETCSDPIKTCDKNCSRLLQCGHICNEPCHDSPCNTCCERDVRIYCICGTVSKVEKCEGFTVEEDIICHTVCNTPTSC